MLWAYNNSYQRGREIGKLHLQDGALLILIAVIILQTKCQGVGVFFGILMESGSWTSQLSWLVALLQVAELRAMLHGPCLAWKMELWQLIVETNSKEVHHILTGAVPLTLTILP